MTTEKEFNLGEKIINVGSVIGDEGKVLILEDVKEFIRLLNEFSERIRKDNTIWRINQDELNDLWIDEINKLAGDKLTK